MKWAFAPLESLYDVEAIVQNWEELGTKVRLPPVSFNLAYLCGYSKTRRSPRTICVGTWQAPTALSDLRLRYGGHHTSATLQLAVPFCMLNPRPKWRQVYPTPRILRTPDLSQPQTAFPTYAPTPPEQV